ncbi:Saccharopine dehydrogenase-domain-containing protein [Schizophyllum fasciatum]
MSSLVAGLKRPLVLGIRREDPTRIWERRAPLVPAHVRKLLEKHKDLRVQVQRCTRRFFTEDQYTEVGAQVVDDLAQAHVILGVKEPPLNEVFTNGVASPKDDSIASRVSLMFSHTAKGQAYNMPLLRKFLSGPNEGKDVKPATLIDYELLVNDAGKRTVGFGHFAGVAGAFEAFHSLGLSLLEKGYATPFLYCPRPQSQPTLETLKAAFHHTSTMIAENGIPKQLGPIIIGLTGSGLVSNGALSVLKDLPHTMVSVEQLPQLLEQRDSVDRKKVYIYHAQPQDYLTRQDGNVYDRSSYYKSPELYSSQFSEKASQATVAPYLTMFINGVGWQPGFPRLMTREDLDKALSLAKAYPGFRFQNIADISCDIEGGLEFMSKSTTLSEPTYVERPADPSLPPVTIMSVDILPASLPFDASMHFSTVLYPYLEDLLVRYAHGEARFSDAVERAIIARDGQLQGPHEWLKEAAFAGDAKATAVSGSEAGEPRDHGVLRRKRVLMLGSGMVAGPAVETIASRSDVQLVIASNSLEEAQKLAAENEGVEYRVVDMADESALAPLVAEADVVISLLPATLHPTVAEACIAHKKHLVTASYISEPMRALDRAARDNGVLLLNEIGLDPGIDHCSAMQLLDTIRARGEAPVSFVSFCGGLPAPEAAGNPFKYKFSWSPRAALTAVSQNPALFRLDGKTHSLRAGQEVLDNHFPAFPVKDGERVLEFEGLPNRDSLQYVSQYGLPNEIGTMLRGTLRYPGFFNLMRTCYTLGLLDTTRQIELARWQDLVPSAYGAAIGRSVSAGDLESLLAKTVSSEQASQFFEAIEWLGLVPGAPAGTDIPLPALPRGALSPLYYFAALLTAKLRFLPGERDLVALTHEIRTVDHAAAARTYRSTLVAYGNDRHSAMARTVGIPVALAALGVLDGRIGVRGVQGATDGSVYGPVLEGLEERGIGMKESVERVPEAGDRYAILDIFSERQQRHASRRA